MHFWNGWSNRASGFLLISSGRNRRCRHVANGSKVGFVMICVFTALLLLLEMGVGTVSAAKPRPWRKWPDMEQWGVGQPAASFAHTMAAMDDGTLWVLAGGVLYKRDLEMKQWSTMTTSGPEPSDRRSAAMATTGEYLYVHGGTSGSQLSDELWAYSIKTGLWSLLASTGNKPSARGYHAMTAVGMDVYIHGGKTSQQRFRNLWRYSPETGSWTDLAEGTRPSVRELHKVTAVGTNIFSFGAWEGSSRKGHLWRYNSTGTGVYAAECGAMNLHFNKYGNEDLSHSGAADSRRMCLVSSTVANKATTQKCFAHTPKKFVMNVVDIKMVCVPMQVVVLIFVLWCLQKISALEPVQRAFKLARCIHVVVTNMQSVMNGAVVVCNRALTRLLITVLPSMKMIFYVRDERKPNLMMILRNLKIFTDFSFKFTNPT